MKILFRGSTLRHNLNPSKAAKMIVKYVRYNASRLIIPSIPAIQHDLHQSMGITEVSFLHDQESYLTLLHRVYLLVFMVHYKMPLQRKHLPGRRNLSTSAYSLECRGWYSYLSHKEQKILNRPNISLCSDSIPDDLLQGKSKNDITDFSKVQFHDVQNSSMFRDGSVDNMVFQRDIQIYRHQRTKFSQKLLQTSILLTHRDNDCSPSQLSDKESTPSLNTIQSTVKTIVQQCRKKNRVDVKSSSWNSMFHEIIECCDISSNYPPNSLPQSYEKGNDCGHTEHVNLENTIINTLFLTVLEHIKGHADNDSSYNTASSFINFTIYQNPVWDLGLQHKLLCRNFNKDYSANLANIRSYNSSCICPCSVIFDPWHQQKGISLMKCFKQCDSDMFGNINSFVTHVYSMQDCYFHRIIMRIIQSTYSPLISKIRIRECEATKIGTTFSKVHEKKVTLPPYIESNYDYQSYRFQK